ncbi:uncharacterized protein PpBr36_10273 [Pyricularia pennisetigena]|uniref:uncharacterized protein n=1 Tax=Pyricularia pennisetigena TaxID=1578925 RepID=UPI001152FD31|nr:uncharacterized protein PpBr36_10273 [Pyricularia pennisetigena]TLS21530.1 hypothetical protein PpBr36_10273 [Pyricularia pennisetigena]
MKSTLYLATGALGMVTIAHAIPAFLTTTTNSLDTAGRTTSTDKPVKHYAPTAKVSDENHPVLKKRAKEDRVDLEITAGTSRSRGGGLPADTAEEWKSAARKALAAYGCNRGTIVHGPHSSNDSSSSDSREHITVQPHDGGHKMHVYIDGTYTQGKTAHKKGRH